MFVTPLRCQSVLWLRQPHPDGHSSSRRSTQHQLLAARGRPGPFCAMGFASSDRAAVRPRRLRHHQTSRLRSFTSPLSSAMRLISLSDLAACAQCTIGSHPLRASMRAASASLAARHPPPCLGALAASGGREAAAALNRRCQLTAGDECSSRCCHRRPRRASRWWRWQQQQQQQRQRQQVGRGGRRLTPHGQPNGGAPPSAAHSAASVASHAQAAAKIASQRSPAILPDASRALSFSQLSSNSSGSAAPPHVCSAPVGSLSSAEGGVGINPHQLPRKIYRPAARPPLASERHASRLYHTPTLPPSAAAVIAQPGDRQSLRWSLRWSLIRCVTRLRHHRWPRRRRVDMSPSPRAWSPETVAKRPGPRHRRVRRKFRRPPPPTRTPPQCLRQWRCTQPEPHCALP